MSAHSRSSLPRAPEDRRCAAWGIDNRVRRRLAPARQWVDRLDVRAGDTVADLGAGLGFYADAVLARVGAPGRLYYVEPDRGFVDRFRGRHPPDDRIRFLETSAAHVPEIPSGSVDRALLSLVLCCLVDKEGVMDELWRILRPGGRALVSYPRFRRLIPRRVPSLRVTPSRWRSLVTRHPWTVLEARRGLVTLWHLIEKPGDSVPPSGR